MPVGADAVSWIQGALAAAGVALLAWSYLLERAGRVDAWRRLRDALLAALALLAAGAYFNFGQLHHPNFIHVWDTYHYYIGSKYFPELGYERLYDCTVVADAEDLGDGSARNRMITDLRTNALVPASTALADPAACKSHFSPQRWTAFKFDLGFFRLRAAGATWSGILRDHGYNATPVWNALGHALTNTGPATKTQVLKLAFLDPALLAAMIAMIAWAFGWRVAAVAVLFLGTEIPGRFYWTGGAFLRHDWLFWLVGSVCLLRKDKPFLAGAFIAYATLLRLFPGIAIAGPACALVEIYRREKRLDRRLLRYFAGGVAASVVLVAAASAVSGGVRTWEDFARNSAKHAATPLINHMGVPTVLSFRPEKTADRLYGVGLADPWELFQKSRAESLREMRPAFVILCGVFLVMLYFAVAGAGAEPWIAASLGIGMIAVGAELTCYYYVFFVGVLLAMARRTEVGILVMALALGWLAFERATTSQWHDGTFVAMSALALVAYAVILLRFAGVLRVWTPQMAPSTPSSSILR